MLTKREAMILGNKEATSIPGTGTSSKPALLAHSMSKCSGLKSLVSFEYSVMSDVENILACFRTSPGLSTFDVDEEQYLKQEIKLQVTSFIRETILSRILSSTWSAYNRKGGIEKNQARKFAMFLLLCNPIPYFGLSK